MNKITRAEIERAELDEWVTRTLKRLMLTIHDALSEKQPLGLPNFLESEFKSNSIRVKIRVDFEDPKQAAL